MSGADDIARASASERIGLVAGAGSRESLARVIAALAREQFALMLFDCVQAFVDAELPVTPAAIVLSLAQDALACPATLIEAVRKSCQPAPIVIVCAGIRRRELRGALAAGTAGVVVYDELDSSLGACLRAVRAGQICVPREHWRETERPILSTREKQVLGLVAMGYMNRQIADRLFLAESTVKGHLSSAFGKLGVHSRNEAADLILNSERGLGMGMLGFSSEYADMQPAVAR